MNAAQHDQADYFLVRDLLGARPDESIRDAVGRVLADGWFGRCRVIAKCIAARVETPADPFFPIREAAQLARRRGWVK